GALLAGGAEGGGGVGEVQVVDGHGVGPAVLEAGQQGGDLLGGADTGVGDRDVLHREQPHPLTPRQVLADQVRLVPRGGDRGGGDEHDPGAAVGVGDDPLRTDPGHVLDAGGDVGEEVGLPAG